MLIKPDQSCLIVIDIQERLVPAMQAPARVIRNTRTLMMAATRLGVPMRLTEQYPKGLGHIVPELGELARNGKTFAELAARNNPEIAHLKATEHSMALEDQASNDLDNQTAARLVP